MPKTDSFVYLFICMMIQNGNLFTDNHAVLHPKIPLSGS